MSFVPDEQIQVPTKNNANTNMNENRLVPKFPGFCDIIPLPGCERYWTYILAGAVGLLAIYFMIKIK